MPFRKSVRNSENFLLPPIEKIFVCILLNWKRLTGISFQILSSNRHLFYIRKRLFFPLKRRMFQNPVTKIEAKRNRCVNSQRVSGVSIKWYRNRCEFNASFRRVFSFFSLFVSYMYFDIIPKLLRTQNDRKYEKHEKGKEKVHW